MPPEQSHRSSRRSRRKRQRETPQQIARTRRRHIWALVALSLLVYVSALPGEFVWTDHQDILQGEYRLTDWNDVGDALTLPASQYRARFDGAAPDLQKGAWQPAAILSNTLSWWLWGDCKVCWHLETLLWHLLVVIGLYVVGRQVLAQQRLGSSAQQITQEQVDDVVRQVMAEFNHSAR